MNVEEAKTLLADYRNKLSFEEEGEYIIVRFKEYQRKETWDKVNTLVRQGGGEYKGGIGKNSHWRFPKEQKRGEGKVTQTKKLKQLREDLEALKQHLTDVIALLKQEAG